MMTQMRKRSRSPAKRQAACCDDIVSLIPPRFFKALCDPGRIGMLCRLATCREPCTVSQVSECCPTDLSVVSRHLALLRDAGVLRAEKRGKEVYYSVDTETVVGTLRAIADAIETCCPPESTRPRAPRPKR